jgi:hypothetical protein
VLEAGNTIRVTYGGQTTDISFDDQTASLASDRTTAGDDNEIVLSLTDRDANTDPTLVDTFSFVTPTNLLTSTNPITYNSALWQETGQNTGIFEQTITVNGLAGTNSLNATLPTGNTFTVTDHEVFEALTGSTPPFDAIDATSSTSSASVTLQNADAVVTLMNSTSFANGLKAQIADPDRNISTQDEDDITGQVTVSVEGVSGTLSGVTFTETGDSTGLFIADLTRDSIPIAIGSGTSTLASNTITLNVTTIQADPDITLLYNDTAPQTGAFKLFQVVTGIDTTAGTLTTPLATVGVTDKFTLELTDADLNTNPQTIETYTVSSGTFPNGVGTLTLDIANAAQPLPVSGLTISFIETGVNTGIFRASNLEMNAINTVAGGLDDGERIEFTYNDLLESPAEDSDVTITTGVPNEDITVDRTTVPIPVTTPVKINLSVVDPNANQNSGSTETVTIPVSGQSVDQAGSGTSLDLADFTSGLNSVITLTETGPSTGIFTDEIDLLSTASIAELRDAKITFEYGDESVTVTLRAYDGSISTDKAAVKSGDSFVVTVADQDRNRDPKVAEKTVTVTVESVDDDIDTQTFTLTETGPNTGIFQEEIEVGSDIEVADLAAEDFSNAL